MLLHMVVRPREHPEPARKCHTTLRNGYRRSTGFYGVGRGRTNERQRRGGNSRAGVHGKNLRDSGLTTFLRINSGSKKRRRSAQECPDRKSVV